MVGGVVAVAGGSGAGLVDPRLASSFHLGRQTQEIWSLSATTYEMEASAAVEESGFGRPLLDVVERVRILTQLWGPCPIANVVLDDACS